MPQLYRVWWIPQVPGKPFHVEVESVQEGAKVLKILANYDKFQLDNNIKGDYCNVGGLEVFDPYDNYEDPKGRWVSWFDEDTNIEDPQEYLDHLKRNPKDGV